MAIPNLTIPPDKVLLVEGQNDKHVVRHICIRHSLTPNFQTLDKGNVDELIESISLEVKASGRKAVGIMLDANDNLTSRWDAVSEKLSRSNVKTPRCIEKGGTIISGAPRVGIWIMPNNNSVGELEDFVVTMIHKEDSIWPLFSQYIDQIPKTHRKFKNKKTSRAKLYAWLATRENPNRMGTAIGAKDLDVDGELCNSFIEWLRKLFC